jgi:hypothetical protein
VTQAFGLTRVDVLGSDHRNPKITVFSHPTSPDSLPRARWSAIAVVDLPVGDVTPLVRALRSACRSGGYLLFVTDADRLAEISEAAAGVQGLAWVRSTARSLERLAVVHVS